MPSGARGGVFHLGYKLAITAHEVGGERTHGVYAVPSGARGGMFHLGYKLAITAHEVGGERTRTGISTRESPGAGQLGGPVSDR